jgi:hypothetical protein
MRKIKKNGYRGENKEEVIIYSNISSPLKPM